MATKKKIKFDPTKDRVVTFNRDGEKLSEVNGELKSDFYSGIEQMCYLSDEYCAFYKGKKMGILDSKGEIITPAEWESIKYEGKVFRVSKKSKVTKFPVDGYINVLGEELFNPDEYDYVNDVYDDRIVVTSHDTRKQGAFDLDGNMVVTPKYLRLGNFCNNVAVAYEEEGKVGLVDSSGNWTLQPEYSSIGSFRNNFGLLKNYCIIKKDGKTGLISKDLQIVVEPKYEDIRDFDDTEGLIFVVKSGEKEGLADANGNLLIPAEYDKITISHEGHYIELEKNAQYGLSDMKGRVIVDDLKVSNLSMEYGLLNIELCDGTEIKRADGFTVFKGEKVKIFQEIILVSTDGKRWGVINHDGEELLSQEYSLPTQNLNQVQFSEGLLNLNGDSKSVYIDKKGEVKITLDCRGWAFSQGYAIIGENGDYGIINASGEIVAAHLARIKKLGGGYIFINNEEQDEPKILNVGNGEQVAIPARVVDEPVNGYVKIQTPDHEFGVVSISDGKVILDPIYSQILLTADGIWGYIPEGK
jgi:hypothetical protein